MSVCKLSNPYRWQNNTSNIRQNSKRKIPITIGTWNVRSLQQLGKLKNVLMEINRMNIDIMGIAETFYDGADDFEASLVTTNKKI